VGEEKEERREKVVVDVLCRVCRGGGGWGGGGGWLGGGVGGGGEGCGGQGQESTPSDIKTQLRKGEGGYPQEGGCKTGGGGGARGRGD